MKDYWLIDQMTISNWWWLKQSNHLQFDIYDLVHTQTQPPTLKQHTNRHEFIKFMSGGKQQNDYN